MHAKRTNKILLQTLSFVVSVFHYLKLKTTELFVYLFSVKLLVGILLLFVGWIVDISKQQLLKHDECSIILEVCLTTNKF